MKAMSIHAFSALAIFVLTMGTGSIVLAQNHNVPTVHYQQPVCVISGIVQSVQVLEKSPWNDGTPTTLTATEIHIAVALQSRSMQRGTSGSGNCNLPLDQSPVLYKLCSPTQIKKGDHIKGVEGMATGTNQSLGCLFDVAVDTNKAGTGQ